MNRRVLHIIFAAAAAFSLTLSACDKDDGAKKAEDAGGDTGDTGEAEDGEAEAGEAEGGDDKAEDDKSGGDKSGGEKTASAPKVDGKPLYEKKCKSCHGLDGKGDTKIGKKVDIPSLSKTKLSKSKVVSAITNGVADTKMKAFKDKLSKDEIDGIAAYVKKL